MDRGRTICLRRILQGHRLMGAVCKLGKVCGPLQSLRVFSVLVRIEGVQGEGVIEGVNLSFHFEVFKKFSVVNSVCLFLCPRIIHLSLGRARSLEYGISSTLFCCFGLCVAVTLPLLLESCFRCLLL